MEAVAFKSRRPDSAPASRRGPCRRVWRRRSLRSRHYRSNPAVPTQRRAEGLAVFRRGGESALQRISLWSFVTGSDPDTREAWQFEARALAAHGIASLLYDKRGVGESGGASHDLASWDDLAGDVEGAVTYLRTRSDLIDPRRIGLLGQSQGTWIIAKVAARDP